MHLSLLAKTSWLIVSFSLASIFIAEIIHPSSASTNGAPAGRTGSPGDVFSCTSCHPGSAVTIAGLVTSNIPMTGYVPGQTYTFTGSITSVGKTKFGFQISPQDNTGSELGTLVITNPTKTKLVGTTGNYITHLSAGTSFPSGIATWSFDWIAPAAGTGAVTFYGAFNITNNNNNASGDAIRLSTMTVQEALVSIITDNAATEESWNVYPNPAKEVIYLSSPSNSKIRSLEVLDINCRLIKAFEDEHLLKNKAFDISDLKTGVTYLLNIITENGTTVKKFIKSE